MRIIYFGESQNYICKTFLKSGSQIPNEIENFFFIKMVNFKVAAIISLPLFDVAFFLCALSINISISLRSYENVKQMVFFLSKNIINNLNTLDVYCVYHNSYCA